MSGCCSSLGQTFDNGGSCSKAVVFNKKRHEDDVSGPLAQSVERGADNAKVVSSTLTRTNFSF